MTEPRVWIGYPNGRDNQLWRYMDFLKFVDLLQRGALWFTRLDSLPDPFEGSFTNPTLEFFAKVRARSGFRGGLHNEKFRKLRCVNCWHINEHESAAMWSLYSGRNGVAVQSRISLIEGSFSPDSTSRSWGIRGNEVQYCDYECDTLAGLNPDGSVYMVGDYMCKRKSFEHEREYRLAATLEEVERESIGIHIPVALGQLIERVFVSPTAEKWVVEVVRKEVLAHGLIVEVTQSDLYNPRLK